MVTYSRSEEGHPAIEQARDRPRQERLADKSLETAKVITDYFFEDAGLCCVVTPAKASVEPTVAIVQITEVGLNIQHRFHEICVACEDPPAMAHRFRDWVRGNLTHITRITLNPA